MEACGQNVGQHRQVMNLFHGLSLVGKAQQVEVGVGHHDVLSLAADPAAEIHVAIGAARVLVVDGQADVGVPLAAGAATAAGDVERHRDEIALS